MNDLAQTRTLEVGIAYVSDRIDCRPSGGTIAIKAALGELQYECLGRGDASLATVFPNNHLLPKHGLIGQLAASAARTALGVAALALAKTRGVGWITVADNFLRGGVVFAQVTSFSASAASHGCACTARYRRYPSW